VPNAGSIADFAARTRAARRVLVVDLGFLGDSIHLVPALWEVRRHYTNAALHLVSTPVACEVVAMAGCMDQLWPLENMPGRRSLRQQARVIHALRSAGFDAAITLNAVDRSIILTALSGARERLGLLGGRRHFWNAWAIRDWLPQPDASLPMFEQRRQALASAGFALDRARFDLRLTAEAQTWAEAEVPVGAVHLSLNSASPLKEWPAGHYARLSELVGQAIPEVTFVLSATGNPREQARLDEFFRRTRHCGVRRLPAGLSIAQLAAALRRCRLHVGPDSGVIHLAMALGVPTISLFRERAGCHAWLPVGAIHRHVLAPCACESDRNSRCARAGQAQCLKAITPQNVARLVIEALR
jgi:3-deoxy-D-manno-octulosonic-acid transferase